MFAAWISSQNLIYAICYNPSTKYVVDMKSWLEVKISEALTNSEGNIVMVI